MNEKYNTPNSGCCGRPFQYAPSRKCGDNHCCFNEYDYKMNACIRKKQPDCTAQAVIPAVTIETTDGIVNYSNAFVHVTSTNTTYYVDDNHTPIIVWAGNIEVNLPSTVTTEEESIAFVKSFNLRNQYLNVKLYVEDWQKYIIDSFYFDKAGQVYFVNEFEPITEEPLS